MFLDLEKAYDTTYRYRILNDIHKLELRGRLPTFIESFPVDRIMQVPDGSSPSEHYNQEQDVLQGGVLSTTFFVSPAKHGRHIGMMSPSVSSTMSHLMFPIC